MLARVLAIALNTYREAVRARLLLGVFVAGLATCAGSLLVAALSLNNEARVVADVGAASFSLYGVIAAIVLGSTSLYRELEHKTVFPILSRPIRRWEYLLGKYAGTLLTVAVFIAVEAAVVMAALAVASGETPWKVGAVVVAMLAALGGLLARRSEARTFVGIPWAFALAVAAWCVAGAAGEERQLVVASAVLAFCEIAIVAAIATLFASFSSPFLTATFTSMVFVIGRRSDMLAHLPAKVFGATLGGMGRALARIVPNLQAYVPARPLLLGQVAAQPVWGYVALAALHAASYAAALLVVSALTFRKRDFA
jgi:small basic protein